LAKEVLKQLHANLDNSNFWNSHLLYDLYAGMFYSLIGLPHMLPAWITIDEKEITSEVHMPIAELIVCLSSCIALKKYDQALTILHNSYPRNQYDRFLFSELQFVLISAVAKINTDDTRGAIEDFKQAYALSFDGVFEMVFVEMGKNLQPLITSALSCPSCNVPDEWLKKISRKASVYAKKAIVVSNAFKGEEDVKNAVHLSNREREVLKDLYDGLSREEIAENRYLSINTVKKILQSIYIKLNAKNNVDAIRIAIEKKLL
jgi:LuxR family maltose regulon positive regulatory protein